MKLAVALEDLTEKEWDAQLFNAKKGLASTCGWRLVYHTFRSKGSQPGFPDRVLARDRVIFVELKREKEKPTDRQRAWLDGLAHAGAEVYLWRPSDLAECGEILARRWTFVPRPPDAHAHLEALNHDAWTPRSLWVGGGRADSLPSLFP